MKDEFHHKYHMQSCGVMRDHCAKFKKFMMKAISGDIHAGASGLFRKLPYLDTRVILQGYDHLCSAENNIFPWLGSERVQKRIKAITYNVVEQAVTMDRISQVSWCWSHGISWSRETRT